MPSPAHAATCDDHANQASAQRAKDTRDADKDGIYCEALPCPCLGASRAEPPRVLGARIIRVIDGDTIRVRTRRRRLTVRLIGIDTPETKRPGVGVECGGRRATRFMRRLAFNRRGRGRRVTLTTDPTQDTLDRYGRLLAYVKPRRRPLLQIRMLRRGWARVYVYGGRPFRRVRAFRRAERSARRARRGVWGMCRSG